MLCLVPGRSAWSGLVWTGGPITSTQRLSQGISLVLIQAALSVGPVSSFFSPTLGIAYFDILGSTKDCVNIAVLVSLSDKPTGFLSWSHCLGWCYYWAKYCWGGFSLVFKNFHCFLQLLLKSHSEFVVTILVSPITEPQQHSNVTNLGPRPVFLVVG